jgi:hypothetical protein
MKALDDVDLVPQADPNTASQTQRLMKVAALKQLVQSNPALYDPIAVDTAALQALGWSNPQQFMVPASVQANPPPELIQAQANMANQAKEADARVLDAQTRAKQVEADIALTQAKTQEIMANLGGGMPGSEGGDSFQDQVKIAELKLQHQDMVQRSEDAALDAVNRKRDRESRERLAAMRFAETAMQNPAGLGVAQQIIDPEMLQRLESTENPLTPTPSPDGKLE